MSDRTSQNLKPVRVRPAASARDAYSRWGFAGQARAGKIDAYTAEHYAADVDRGVIVNVPRSARGCPRRRPERECRPDDVPEYYRSSWRQRMLFPAVDPTPANPYPKPRRRWTVKKTICLDCKTWIQWCARREFIEEVGDDALGYANNPTLADHGDVLRVLHDRAVAGLELIHATSALTPEVIEWTIEEHEHWQPIIHLAQHMRRWEIAYESAIAAPIVNPHS